MQWSRVKTILICTLLAANAFLAFFNISHYYGNNYIGNGYAKNAAAALSKRGLVIKADAIPRRIADLPVLTIRSDSAYFQQMAAILLGSGFKMTTVGGYTVMQSSVGKFEISSATSFAFHANSSLPVVKSPANSVKEFFVNAGLKDMYKVTRTDVTEERTVITIEQIEGKTPVRGCGAVFTFGKEGLTAIQGRWVFTQTATLKSLNQTDAVNTLFSVLTAESEIIPGSATISVMRLVYYPSENAAYANIKLIPAYLITYGDGTSYLFDLSADKLRYDCTLEKTAE